MQTGELTESVRNRSVFKQLHLKTADMRGWCKGDLSAWRISTAGPLPGYTDRPWRQVTAAANSLAASGVTPLTLCLQGILPETYEEARLQKDMEQFAAEAESNGMKFCDADIQISSATTLPQYFVTAFGENGEEAPACRQYSDMEAFREKLTLELGQELVVTRQIALAGTAALVLAHENELRNRYPFQLIDRAKGFDRWMSITEAARAVNHFGGCPVRCIAQGGIFNALWEMAEEAGVGLEVELKKIPVMQETIEICEYFDMNPYYLYSAGALLIGTRQAEALIAFLREVGIPACVIGRVTDSNDRIIRNGENRRFLDRPRQDELWKIR
ncbi:MAG: hypothetical protein LUH07_04240 [Lachnospiraceae bacterium]|nr:hypothetical protein [Lachnospiraceae bacterium]